MTRQWLLAVDAGGTSTRAAVLTADGSVHGHGRSGSGNPTASGTHDASASLREAVTRALVDASAAGPDIVRVAAAVAGARAQEALVGRALAAAGIDAPFTLESDLLAVFCSGTAGAAGYALIAGTGAAAIRVHAGRVVRAADGLGWMLGDEGSGFWIGRRVVLAAVRALEGSGPPTRLTALVLESVGLETGGLETSGLESGGLEATGIESVGASSTAAVGPVADEDGRPMLLHDLSDRLRATPPVSMARFAPLAFAAADDPVAQAIIRRAGECLVSTLERVTLRGEDGPVVLGGGVLSRQVVLAETVATALRERGHDGPILLAEDGAVGAATLALRHQGIAVDPALHDRLRTSWERLRSADTVPGPGPGPRRA